MFKTRRIAPLSGAYVEGCSRFGMMMIMMMMMICSLEEVQKAVVGVLCVAVTRVPHYDKYGATLGTNDRATGF